MLTMSQTVSYATKGLNDIITKFCLFKEFLVYHGISKIWEFYRFIRNWHSLHVCLLYRLILSNSHYITKQFTYHWEFNSHKFVLSPPVRFFTVLLSTANFKKVLMISKCFQFLFSSILYKIWLFNEFISPFIMHTYSSFNTGFYIVESLKNEYNFVLIFSTS